MACLETTLLRVDWQEAILPLDLPLVCLWKGLLLDITTPLMRKGYPLIPLPLREHLVGGIQAGEIEAVRVAVTPMKLTSPG